MNKKRKASLIIAIVLSLAIFFQNIQAIRVVRAAEPSPEEAAELPVDPELISANGLDADDDAGTKKSGKKSGKKAAKEEVSEEADDKAASEEAEQKAAEEAEQKAAEEAERKAAEEAERKAAEEAEQKAAKEAEQKAAEEAAAKEEASRAAAEERRREEEKKAEAERQAAYEKAAEEAEEADRKAREEAAAKEAKRIAEEQAKESERASEEAAKAAEEASKEAENNTYSLSASVQMLDFGTDTVGAIRDTASVSITNTGKTSVELIASENDPNGAFEFAISSGGSYKLSPGDVRGFQVKMGSNLKAGKYEATLLFADKDRDPNFRTGVSVKLKGTVTAKEAVVTNVSVSPAKINLTLGSDARFYAAVKGNGEVSQDVLWSIENQKSSGTKISSDGVLNIASNETSGKITVIARAMTDKTISGKAIVTPQRGGFNVSTAADPKDGGSVTGGGAVSQGGSVTLSAVPGKNYYFVGWIQNGKKVSTSTNYKISNIQSNMSVTAKFERDYVTVKVEMNDKDGGTVAGGGKVTYGESTTISAKAYSGYVFTGWKEDGKIISRDASMKLKDLKEDRKIKAIFERTSHTITLSTSPAEGGSVSGGGTFDLGKGTTLSATPASGYSFVGWQVNGQIVNRNATVKIDRLDRDYNCTAIFVKTGVSVYEISAGVATTGGTISPAGKISVAQGQNVTYKITPKSGFAVLAVAVDGQQIGAVNSYTFSNVQGNHTIAAAFLLTDAGRAAAAASGQAVQAQKVQKIEKTGANTATSESTVSLENAVSGEAGDEYVEEIEGVEDMMIPTDEMLGIEEEEEIQNSVVTQIMGVSAEDAVAMAQAGNNAPILDAAFYAGTMTANVDNTMEPITKTGIDYANLTAEELMQVADEDINPSLPNLDTVVQRMLSTDEVISIVDGAYSDISVSITREPTVDPAAEKVMKNAVGQKPLQYFDLTMIKSVAGNTERVTELQEPMEVIIEVPDEIYKKNYNYSIIRVHDGELTVLPDLDDDPKTITFRTDRFSSYAIAREVASSRDLVTWFALGATIALAVAITCMLILILHQQKLRRARRRARAEQRRREERY